MSNAYAELDHDSRLLYLVGEIDSQMVFETLKAVEELGKGGNSEAGLRVLLSSCGGGETDAYAIFDALRSLTGGIVVDAIGTCWSAATIVLQAGDTRRISPYASFLLHDSLVPKEEPPVNAGHLRRMNRLYERDEARYANLLASRSKLTSNKIKSMCKDETYLTAHEVVKYGLADEIIKTRGF